MIQRVVSALTLKKIILCVFFLVGYNLWGQETTQIPQANVLKTGSVSIEPIALPLITQEESVTANSEAIDYQKQIAKQKEEEKDRIALAFSTKNIP